MPNNVHNNLVAESSAYFKNLAIESTLITYDGNNGQYKEMGIEEIAALGSNLKFNGFGMIYEPVEVKFSGKNINDARATPAIALWFVKYAKKDDFVARKAVEEEAYRIASSFLARIKLDQEKYARGEDSDAVFKNFDLDTVEIYKTGLVGDYHYGYILEFQVFNDGMIAYDEDDWAVV